MVGPPALSTRCLASAEAIISGAGPALLVGALWSVRGVRGHLFLSPTEWSCCVRGGDDYLGHDEQMNSRVVLVVVFDTGRASALVAAASRFAAAVADR